MSLYHYFRDNDFEYKKKSILLRHQIEITDIGLFQTSDI